MTITTHHLSCTKRSALPLVLVLTLGGCAQSSELQPQGFGWTKLAWQECPAEVPGSSQGQCALAEVPLDWQDDSGPTIHVFCRRFRPEGPVRGQLWALDGGPGEAGDGFVAPQFLRTVLDAGYELIVPSHRGSAYGTALACPHAHDEATCIGELFDSWKSELVHFDTHAAARDVRALATGYPADDDQRTLIFGGSYGTVWGQRVLQVAPHHFDGAYFDSLGDVAMSFEQVGAWTNRVGHEVLGLCAASPACHQRFAGGVEAATARLATVLADGGGCLAQVDSSRDRVQALFMSLLDGVDQRALIAPLLQRFDRCDEAARADIVAALSSRNAGTAATTRTYNPLLNLVVTYRELYRTELDESQIAALDRRLLFDDGAMVGHHQRRRRFPADFARAVDVATGDFSGDLHLVQGALDPRTPENVIDLVGARWPLARLHRLLLPQAGHASPRFTQRRDGDNCSVRWLMSFLGDPRRDLDEGCLADVPPIDVAGQRRETQTLAKEHFGWNNVWQP